MSLPFCGTTQQLGLDILDGKKQVDIPFKFTQGFLMLNVRFQHFLPLQLLYDTGAEHTIMFKKDLVQLFDLPFDKSIKILGADHSQEMYANVVRNVNLQVENTGNIHHDIVVLEDNLLHFEELIGQKIDGILGSSFFRGLIVRVNYKKSKITIYDPKHFQEPSAKDYQKIPIEVHNYKPYIQAQMTTDDSKIYNINLLLDTGAALGLLLNTNTIIHSKLPKLIVPGSLGKGLGGELMGFLGKTKELHIGAFQFSHLLTHFQDLDSLYEGDNFTARNGLIGNDILSRFDIYFDYFKGYIYLKAQKNYNKAFEYDKSGLLIYTVGSKLDKFYVKKVIAGSPADLAGIKAGDIITKIGWCKSKWLSLSKISKKLSGHHGKKIKLQVLRNQEKQKFEFQLVDPFLEIESN